MPRKGKAVSKRGSRHPAVRKNPLHRAASEGAREVARELVEAGADVNGADEEDEWTPLDVACHYGHAETAVELISLGAKVDPRADGSPPALHIAICRGHVDTVKALLDAGASLSRRSTDDNVRGHVDFAALDCTVLGDEEEIARMLITHGADPNSHCQSLQNTALMNAAQLGATAVVRVLITHGADVGARNVFEFTALHFAAKHGRPQIMKTLVETGADVNAFASLETTPLHLACEHSHPDAVATLLRLGADETIPNLEGLTPKNCVEKVLADSFRFGYEARDVTFAVNDVLERAEAWRLRDLIVMLRASVRAKQGHNGGKGDASVLPATPASRGRAERKSDKRAPRGRGKTKTLIQRVILLEEEKVFRTIVLYI